MDLKRYSIGKKEMNEEHKEQKEDNAIKIYELQNKFYEDEKVEKDLCSLIQQEDLNNDNFFENLRTLQTNKNSLGNIYPLIDETFYKFIFEHEEEIKSAIEEVQQNTKPFDVTYFSLQTLKNKYLLKTHDNYQENIDNFIIRVSLYLWKDNLTNFKKMYQNMRNKSYTPATPTLFNAGTLSGQLSSCFLLGFEDSLEGIYKGISDTAMISKQAGGVGIHIHEIRSKGSYIHSTNGSASGIIPMIRVLNSTARYIDQGGGKRAGSFALFLEPWHADIIEYLELRRNIGDENLRARDLFYGLWCPSYFMECVMKNKKWFLFDPNKCKGLNKVYGEEFKTLYKKYVHEKLYEKEMQARELWFDVIKSQIETGTPYMLYKDNINLLSNQKNVGMIESTNLCCEIMEYSNKNEYAVCNLSSIALPQCLKENKNVPFLKEQHIVIITKPNCFYCNLLKNLLQKEFQIKYEEIAHTDISSLEHKRYNTSVMKTFPQVYINDELCGGFVEIFNQYLKPEFDFIFLAKLVEDLVENLDRCIDINKYPLEECKRSNLNMRPMGIGVQGLADVFIKLLQPYDSEESKELNRKIFQCMYFHAISKSVELSKQYGPYPKYEGSPLSEGKFHFDLYSDINKYPYQFHYDFDNLREKILTNGVRNSLFIALMPTASTAQVLGNTESFEPVTSMFYVRRTKAGEFYCIHREFQKIMGYGGIWSNELKDRLILNKGSIQTISKIPSSLKTVFKTVWEISQKSIIDMASDRQYFIDQSQSMNIYLTNPSTDLLNRIHFYAYRKNLKTGSYYIRSRSISSSQNFFISASKEKQYLECDTCSS